MDLTHHYAVASYLETQEGRIKRPHFLPFLFATSSPLSSICRVRGSYCPLELLLCRFLGIALQHIYEFSFWYISFAGRWGSMEMAILLAGSWNFRTLVPTQILSSSWKFDRVETAWVIAYNKDLHRKNGAMHKYCKFPTSNPYHQETKERREQVGEHPSTKTSGQVIWRQRSNHITSRGEFLYGQKRYTISITWDPNDHVSIDVNNPTVWCKAKSINQQKYPPDVHLKSVHVIVWRWF